MSAAGSQHLGAGDPSHGDQRQEPPSPFLVSCSLQPIVCLSNDELPSACLLKLDTNYFITGSTAMVCDNIREGVVHKINF